VWAGDFNSSPSSSIYQRISSLQLLHSAYSLFPASLHANYPPPIEHHDPSTTTEAAAVHDAPYTTWKVRANGEVRRTIDFIWFEHSKLAVTHLLEPPSTDLLLPNALPSRHYPSDHVAIGAAFTWRS